MAVRIHRGSIWLTALVIALTAGMVFTPRSDAAEQTVNVCADNLGGFWDWAPDPSNPVGPEDAWRLSAACSGIVALSSVVPTGGGWSNWWRFPSDPDYGRLEFTGASFGLSGSDGSDGGAGNRSQGVAMCSATVCGQVIRPSGPDVLQPEFHEIAFGDGFVPDQSDQFRVIGSCEGVTGAPQPDSCEPGRPLYLWGLSLTFEDNELPVISTTDPGESPPAPPLVVDGWNGIGDHSISVNAQDAGAGVHHLQFMFNATKGQNGWRFYKETGCGSFENFDPLPRPCPQSTDMSYVFGSSSSFSVVPGDNALDISAFDGAGNQSERPVIHFKLDRSLPVAANLTATTSFMNGWQSDPVVNLTWSNGADAYETATNSPVNRAKADVVKYGSFGSSSTKTVNGTNVESLDGLRLPSAGLWRIRLRLWDEAGNPSDYQEIQVGLDSTIPAAPGVAPLAKLGSTQLAAGARVEWTAPSAVPARVCGYAMSVDQSPAADPGTEIEYPGSAVSAPLPRALPDGANFVHLRAISCSGIPGQTANVLLQVDALAPDIALTMPPASGWYGSENPLIARVEGEPGMKLAVSVDDSPLSWTDAASATVLLTDGPHTVIVRAADVWGNQSQRTLNVRYDDSAPQAEFDLFDSSDPAIVRAVARDAGSGLSAALLEYRRVGEADWNAFGSPLYSSGVAQSALVVVQRFPDQSVADGVYDLRLIAFDAAGHRSLTTTRSDGSPATLKLPLRAPASIEVGFATMSSIRKCHGRGRARVCRTRRKTAVRPRKTVAFGSTSVLRGALRDAAGDPIPGATLKLYESVLGGPRRLVGAIASNAAGAFRFTPRPGPSRQFTVRFDGSARLAPAEVDARLLTTGRVLFDRLASRAHGGSTVALRGRVIAPGTAIPPDLNIEFQYFARGSWQKFLVAGAVADVNGGFTATLRFPVSSRRVAYRLRVRVPSPQTGWPYETGVSSVRKLVVVR